MIEKYRDIDKPQPVKLDRIQDSDKSALRSSLMSNETEHGSSHVTRAMHDNLLDHDTMSVDTSPSFAVSTAKLHDGNKSYDGNKSFASETIFEGEEDDRESVENMELVEEDDFYSESGSSDLSSQSGDSPLKAQPDISSANDRGDSPLNKLITTDSSRSLRGSGSKSWRKSLTKVAPESLKRSFTRLARDKQNEVIPVSTKSAEGWGQDSGDTFFCDLNETDRTPLDSLHPKTASDEDKNTADKSGPRGHSDTPCSTTVATTEWTSQGSAAESGYEKPISDMEGMDLYCLQQRINSRLVGNSIRNSRAYDKAPTLEEMGFF